MFSNSCILLACMIASTSHRNSPNRPALSPIASCTDTRHAPESVIPGRDCATGSVTSNPVLLRPHALHELAWVSNRILGVELLVVISHYHLVVVVVQRCAQIRERDTFPNASIIA